ncbi:hypothetical protein [Enterovibrio nigricans]|uniref:Uncharacterized protein n=1 Tax=Enterovibrio nigricans DSM 22720 TaxID=1121868 RepID=A0A1T4W4N1_9GAMM|nr:hypothetical protein [Enterovibrio nigricans]PKF48784.1 hypothetical protein AT251_23605 [Enterovibrio nigricans]SKA72202.1 hypothetical protein SAMN02745132_04740 [Enterovibrio nigricans DSM 22720]
MFAQTLKLATQRTWQAKAAISKAIAIPLVLSYLLDVAVYQSKNSDLAILSSFVAFAMAILVAINVHRVLLLGKASVPSWGRITFGAIERKFVVYTLGYTFFMIGMGVLVYGFNMFVEPFGLILSLVAIIGFALVSCRLSIIFPAIAVGDDISVNAVWQKTEGKTAQLFLLLGVFPILVGVMTQLVSFLGLYMLDLLVGYVAMVYFIAILSFAYEHLSEGSRDDNQDVTIEL